MVMSYSIDQPPHKHKYFEKDQAKSIMDFWVYKIFWNHRLYAKNFTTKKMMNLSTFKMFRRKNPMNLPLSSGVELDTPLEMPFLREYLLDEGEFYYTDAEVMDLFEPDKKVGKLQKMDAKEREFVENRYKDLKRAALIRKVMDKQLEKIKSEVDLKVENLVNETDEMIGAGGKKK
jgi:hypothetical protein